MFSWEIGNFISIRVGRGRAELKQVREKLDQLEVRVTTARDREATLALIEPALTHRLSLFDTAYLRHALGHGGALASRDAALLDAAVTAGVDVFDLRD